MLKTDYTSSCNICYCFIYISHCIGIQTATKGNVAYHISDMHCSGLFHYISIARLWLRKLCISDALYICNICWLLLPGCERHTREHSYLSLVKDQMKTNYTVSASLIKITLSQILLTNLGCYTQLYRSILDIQTYLTLLLR